MLNLDAYFTRISYTGPRTPTLATLRELHALHPQAIAFENLSPLLGQSVSLELADIEAKLVRAGRGGYCFEHNRLFQAALEALGFCVMPLAARVLWGPSPAAVPPRTHMLLLVEAQGERWIADVGFGGVTLPTPLRFEAGTTQDTPHEAFQLHALEDGGWLLRVRLGEVWRDVYRFDLVRQFDVDYAVSNFYVNKHPESPFVSNLLAARLAAGERHTLFNGRLGHYASGSFSHRDLTRVAQLRQVLEEIFRIRLPDADGLVTPTDLDAALQRCIDAP
ncbi:MAG: arylamine N-acetyltransferase family protein [Bordetella sp.]|uniref:arylamine N-acetyltransferase family protein n=1 Tax=Bordetella sp. TaxID=28081 RepID=UPI003F7B6AA2